jgi:dUTPase
MAGRATGNAGDAAGVAVGNATGMAAGALVSSMASDVAGDATGCVSVYIERCREGAAIPQYARTGDAGMDVCSAVDIDIVPGQTALVPTGLKFAIPAGYEIQVRPRSGLSLRTALRLPNSPGTIDSGFRGELCIIVSNARLPLRSAGAAAAGAANRAASETGCAAGEASGAAAEASCAASEAGSVESEIDGIAGRTSDVADVAGEIGGLAAKISGFADESVGTASEASGAAVGDVAYALDRRLDAASLGALKALERDAESCPVCLLGGPYVDGPCIYGIRKGDRIAQIVLKAVPVMKFTEVRSVDEIGESRGGGFGSTGVRANP